MFWCVRSLGWTSLCLSVLVGFKNTTMADTAEIQSQESGHSLHGRCIRKAKTGIWKIPHALIKSLSFGILNLLCLFLTFLNCFVIFAMQSYLHKVGGHIHFLNRLHI